ncbi:F0F1 ATP synthase subunit delta [Actinophytocola sp.]|uniref:F0F1 ATP synthase subunit delta n=1 Tax=Actinophytocola sp. TaxID=1872138 RepID=UPI003D6B351B
MVMQAASREALATATLRLDERIEGTAAEGVRDLSTELFEIAGVLVRERALRRLLADPATARADRTRLADTVFGGKVSGAALETFTGLATARWSRSIDLVDATEVLARHAMLAVAAQDGSLEDVEDELFRFARVLDSETRLRELLVDDAQPADRRLELLDGLVGGKVRPVTLALLRQSVRLPRGRSLEAVVNDLAELAAARRERSVARVTAAVPLTAAQERRLTDALSRMYGRAVSVQVELDPDQLGGLVIRVGDEVIDGSVATRLARARQELSG